MKKPYRFHLPESKSPTYYNLSRYLQAQGWHRTRFKWLAKFTEQHFQFNETAAQQLEFKNLLARLIAAHCPEVMPETYEINDQNWPDVLNRLIEKENIAWILKPAFLNNGRHIHIFSSLSDIEQHFVSMNRLGGEQVLQRYLDRPHLLKGHKYSIRMFVVLTNYAGAFIYPQGYLNVAVHPYQPAKFGDLSAHLTNEHLNEQAENVVQIPSQLFDFFPACYQQIKTIVSEMVAGLQKENPAAFVCKKERLLAVFGFDFLVDDEMRVWLLEANHGPCFPVSDEHPLQAHLYQDFWQAFIESFVVPIAQERRVEEISYRDFEKVE